MPQAFPPKKPLFAACTAPRPHRSITALFWSNYIHTKHSGVRRSMREQDACLSNACGSTRSAQHTAAAAINSTTEPDSTSLPAVMQCVWGSLRGPAARRALRATCRTLQHLIDTQLVHSAALTIAPLVPPSTTTSGTPAPRHVSGDQQDEQRTLPTTLTRLTSLRRLSLCLGPGAALPVLAAAAPQLQHLHLELRCLALSPELIISVANSFPGMLSLSLAGLSTRSVPMQPTQPWRQALSTLPVTLHTLHLASIDQDGWYRRTWLSDTRDLAGLSHLTTLTDLRLTGVACPPLLPPSVCLSELKPLLNAPNARLQHLTIAAVPSSRLSLAFLSQCAASGPALHLALAASPSQLRAAAAADTGWQGAWQRVRTLWLRALTEDLSPADVTSLLSSLPNLRELQSSGLPKGVALLSQLPPGCLAHLTLLKLWWTSANDLQPGELSALLGSGALSPACHLVLTSGPCVQRWASDMPGLQADCAALAAHPGGWTSQLTSRQVVCDMRRGLIVFVDDTDSAAAQLMATALGPLLPSLGGLVLSSAKPHLLSAMLTATSCQPASLTTLGAQCNDCASLDALVESAAKLVQEPGCKLECVVARVWDPAALHHLLQPGCLDAVCALLRKQPSLTLKVCVEECPLHASSGARRTLEAGLRSRGCDPDALQLLAW